MQKPDPLEIARCLYPEFAADCPSKGFTSIVPLTFSLFAILLTVAQPRGLSLPPEQTARIIGLLLAAIIILPSITIRDSFKHRKNQNEALDKAYELIAIVHLDPNFQILPDGDGLRLEGLPKSSTPILTKSFKQLRQTVTEKEFIAIAPLLEPLRMRFQ